MGYRSEVSSLIYGKPEAIDKFIMNNSELIDTIKKDFDNSLKICSNSIYKLIHLDLHSVKWYESYEDVTRWHHLLKLADEADLITEFVRTGEENGDVEANYTHDNCEFYVNPVSYIETCF